MVHHRHRPVAVVAALTLIGALAGCGGGTETAEDSSADTEPPPNPPAATTTTSTTTSTTTTPTTTTTTTEAPPPIFDLSGIDPCSLLTYDEVGRFFPDPVLRSWEDTFPVVRNCWWDANPPCCALGHFLTVGVAPRPPDLLALPEVLELDMRAVPLQGLGDEAYVFFWVPDPDFSTEEQVFTVLAAVGGLAIQTVPGPEVFEDTPELETLLDLVRLVVDRIP